MTLDGTFERGEDVRTQNGEFSYSRALAPAALPAQGAACRVPARVP